MIAYIKGTITFKNPTFILVEAGGIGYHVNISLNTYARIEKLENIKILTHLLVREDSHTLYGFADDAELADVRAPDFRFRVAPLPRLYCLLSLRPKTCVRPSSAKTSASPKSKRHRPKDGKTHYPRPERQNAEGWRRHLADTPDPSGQYDAGGSVICTVCAGIQPDCGAENPNQILRDHPGVSTVEELIKLALKQMS